MYGEYVDMRVRAYLRRHPYGYNTAEIKTKDLAEKELGLAAKQYAESKIGNKIIYIQFENLDKYGRPLVSTRREL